MTAQPLAQRGVGQHTSPASPAAQVDVDPEQLTVVRSRHPWRWVGAIIGLVLAAQFINGLVTNPGWDWPTFAATSPHPPC